jgi:hypothetical protein
MSKEIGVSSRYRMRVAGIVPMMMVRMCYTQQQSKPEVSMSKEIEVSSKCRMRVAGKEPMMMVMNVYREQTTEALGADRHRVTRCSIHEDCLRDLMLSQICSQDARVGICTLC